MEKLNNETLITFKHLMCMTMADIDIFLLREEDQKTDKKKKYYTKEEIRQQLQKSLIKIVKTMRNSGMDIDKKLEFNQLLIP